jgi:DNA invertase Pin-like site-specific DNA recombinase
MKRYIAYLRVSTKAQGMTGLGMEAQKQSVKNFLSSNGISDEIEYFIEVEKGRRPDRKELRQAIHRCKETKSTLLIAKLDRLSRDVVFIFTLRNELQHAGVDFMALDLPEANTLTLGIMASFAQHEAERISQRTKDGLNSIKKNIAQYGYHVSKKSGQKIDKLGNTRLSECNEKANIASCQSRKDKKQNDTLARQTYNYALLLKEKNMGVSEIATELNRAGYTAPKGGKFIQQHISRLLRDGKMLWAGN